MKRYSLNIVTILILTATSCHKQHQIANSDDYDVFLKSGVIQQQVSDAKEQLRFWEGRLRRDTGNYVDMMEMARCHLCIFKNEGNVTHLAKADSLLKRSSEKLNGKDPEILFAIAQNSITRHEFRQAGHYTQKAGQTMGDQYIYHLIGFDTKMEMGDRVMASKVLDRLADKSSFDYLIRKSKLEDQHGNLEDAIKWMEKAFEEVKESNSSLYCWSLSNLADMYGHAGRIKDAYNAYLKVLQRDSGYTYALRGIAWIAYAHDHNGRDAKRILEFILSQSNQPDVLLQLAEIEVWEGNTAARLNYVTKFVDEVKKPGYGEMYNRYLIMVYTDVLPDLEKALQLAEKEVTSRATPETYDWLARVHYKRGEIDKAWELINNFVYKRNFEPEALLNTAMIFLAAGEKKKARALLKECLDSSFELGPVTTKFILEQLN